MFDIPPDPIAFQLGPFAIGWYGLCYAIGLAVAYMVLTRLARAAGEDPELVGNGIIIVSVAALIGGRLYHVIDQWAIYANAPITAILPITFADDGSVKFTGFAGLGVYGGIVTGTLAAWWYARRHKVSFARWADIVAPALFVMQAIGRWGNYFNQELYGPPTTQPWGIAIDCAHRLPAYACDIYPETTRFHPLFLYESISGLLGAAFLVFLGYRLRSRLRPGDLLLVFFIWYGVTRFVLEFLRADNWTFFGIPTAQLVSLAFIAVGVVGLFVRHRASRMGDRPPSNPQVATWGALGAAWMTRPIDEPWANVAVPGDAKLDDDADDADDAEDVRIEPGTVVDDDAAQAADEPGPRPTT
jgi:phosphatidylglycerol:prolipoprotein diacylglycerol transferase